MLVDERADRIVAHLAGPEGLDVERDRMRATDHIRDLELAAIGEPGLHDVLRDVARGVRAGTVDLGRILPAERAAAVTGVSAVGVDDDLAAGQSRIAHRTADREGSRSVDDVLGLRVEPRLSDRRTDDVLPDLVLQTLVIDTRIVLRRDHDRVAPLGLPASIFDGHLGLSVGTTTGQP